MTFMEQNNFIRNNNNDNISQHITTYHNISQYSSSYISHPLTQTVISRTLLPWHFSPPVPPSVAATHSQYSPTPHILMSIHRIWEHYFWALFASDRWLLGRTGRKTRTQSRRLWESRGGVQRVGCWICGVCVRQRVSVCVREKVSVCVREKVDVWERESVCMC